MSQSSQDTNAPEFSEEIDQMAAEVADEIAANRGEPTPVAELLH